jgi:hypothetical protein
MALSGLVIYRVCRSGMWLLCPLAMLAWIGPLSAQGGGPRSPSTAVNNNAIGSHNWSSPGNVVASNNSRATVATRGITHYLQATDFGFDIPQPASITGIELEVERSTSAVNSVAILGSSPFWTTGLSRPALPAGVNRCLIVVAAMENGDGFGPRDITAMSYGGRAMTQLTEVSIGGGTAFSATIEVWMMLEADLALASGTTITRTYAATPGAHSEYCETFSSAVFQHVDQVVPISSMHTSGSSASTNPHQLGANINTLVGSMAVNAVVSGNRPSSNPSANTSTTGYTINSSYTEGTDFYFANASTAPNTGATLQVAHKAITANGTEQPSCTFNGSVNRHVMVGFTLQRARELDHSVRLVKAGNVVGEDRASSLAWTTTDTYITYGGPTDTWGENWTLADVNSAQFGAAISARVQSATARLDHLRITVYAFSTLPVELVRFDALPDGGRVKLTWSTATERDNERFVVLRGRDAIDLEEVLSVTGAGNSQQMLHYEAFDERPLPGTTYYRLKQVDHDGTEAFSHVVAVTMNDAGATVYPNPTDGVVTIRTGSLELAEVSILNSRLQVVRTARLVDGDPMLNLSGIPDGMYILLLHTAAGTEAVRVVKASRIY